MRSSRSSPATAPTAARSRCRRTRRTTPKPTWHQVAELPKLAAQVTEYQGHYRTCPCCGRLNHAPIPQGLKAHSVGPRLAATLAYLAGSHRASNRGLEEITEDVFDVPIALGTVANLRTEVSDALAPAHAEAVQARPGRRGQERR